MKNLSEFEEMSLEEANNFMKTKEKQEIRDVMVKYVNEIGGNILDAGCGRGIDAHRYKEEYLGIDISSPLIEIARKNNPDHAFRVNDLRDIKYDNNSFDNVICLSVFEHVHSEEDAVKILDELIRVCNKQLLIGWHLPPMNTEKSVFTKVKTIDVKRLIHQNRYTMKIFEHILSKVRSIEKEQIEEWELWKIKLDFNYNEFFTNVYNFMNKYVSANDTVVEICCRRERCGLSSKMFNYKKFIGIDKDHSRRIPNIEFKSLDATKDELPECNIMITTALIQHYPKEETLNILKNMAKNTKELMIIMCPNGKVQKKLYGDHKYHPLVEEIEEHLDKIGFEKIKVQYLKDIDFETKKWTEDGIFIIVMGRKNGS